MGLTKICLNLLFFYFAFCLALFSPNNVGGRVILSHLFSLLIVQKQPLAEFLKKHLYIFVQAINTQNMRESTEKQFHCEIRMKECVCVV